MFENIIKYSEKDMKCKKDEINICIFFYDDVTFYLRLLSIFDKISHISRYNFYIVYEDDILQLKEDIYNKNILIDYFIIQRNWLDFEISDLIYDNAKLLNYKIIFEIDDDLINMDESNPGYPYFMEIKNVLRSMVQKADIVTVSTNHLRNRLLNLNKNIIVIPNRLIDLWFENEYNKTKSHDVVKIGYMGSIYHSWDLVLIEEAIKKVKSYFIKKDIDVIFEVIGGTESELTFASQINVPEENKSYFKFIPWLINNVNWVLAIAPLEESNLNNAKSELKYLEYAALKIPGIYSSIGPYKENVTHEKTGLLVYDNTTEEWTENIIKLIENKNLRKEIIENSYNDVINNYLIDKSVNQWIRIFEKNYNPSFKLNLKRFIKNLF